MANLKHMIPDRDVANVICSEVPELKKRIFLQSGTVTLYQNIHLLADLSVKFIQQHNFNSVLKCFQVAERLLAEGSQTTKNAIENVFVYSVTTRTEGHSAELKDVLRFLPVGLKAEYYRQISHF